MWKSQFHIGHQENFRLILLSCWVFFLAYDRTRWPPLFLTQNPSWNWFNWIEFFILFICCISQNQLAEKFSVCLFENSYNQIGWARIDYSPCELTITLCLRWQKYRCRHSQCTDLYNIYANHCVWRHIHAKRLCGGSSLTVSFKQYERITYFLPCSRWWESFVSGHLMRIYVFAYFVHILMVRAVHSFGLLGSSFFFFVGGS